MLEVSFYGFFPCLRERRRACKVGAEVERGVWRANGRDSTSERCEGEGEKQGEGEGEGEEGGGRRRRRRRRRRKVYSKLTQ